jgi:hypothetical protein
LSQIFCTLQRTSSCATAVVMPAVSESMAAKSIRFMFFSPYSF